MLWGEFNVLECASSSSAELPSMNWMHQSVSAADSVEFCTFRANEYRCKPEPVRGWLSVQWLWFLVGEVWVWMKL